MHEKMGMQTRRPHCQITKGCNGSFRALQCAHALKKVEKIIKGRLLHSKEMKEWVGQPLGLHNALMHSKVRRVHNVHSQE